MITKKELLVGVIKFVKNEVIPHISEKSLRIVLSGALYAIDAKPAIVDPFLNSPIVSAILQGENGMYDTDTIFAMLENLAKDYGGIPVTIPPIKFVTSTETTLTFYSGDIAKLKEYVLGEEKNA